MWLLNVFFLLCIVCLGKGEENCWKERFYGCKNPVDELEFPKSDAELDTLCLNIKNFAECTINCAEKSPETFGRDIERAHSLLNASKSFCKNDSSWYKGVLKYGYCFDNFLLDVNYLEECSNVTTAKFDEVFSNMRNQPELFRCYFDIQIATCVIERLSNVCGRTAKELALHFVNRIGFWNIICLDFQEEADNLLNDLNISFYPETSEEEFDALIENWCTPSFNEQCPRPNHFYYPFPESYEELAIRCSQHIMYRHCLIDYTNECGKETWNIHGLHADIETLRKFCGGHPVLFKALFDNGKCFSRFPEALTNDRLEKCQSEIRNKCPEKYDEMFNMTNELGNVEETKCFQDISFVSCFVEAVSEDCGDTARELILQALHDNGMNNTMCTNKEKEAETFMQEMSLNFDPKSLFHDFVSELENKQNLESSNELN